MSNVSLSQQSTRLISSFPSLALNLFIAMSATKPPASDSVQESATDVPHTAVTECSEQVPIAIGSSKNDRGEAVSPRPKSRRRSSQSKTSYRLAHPAPSTRQRQRFRIRPRTLLQLQQISNTSRPEPVIDVLPSVLFAPRLARRAPQIFQGKQGVGLDDLVVVHSQTHEPAIDAQARLSQAVGDESPNDSEIIAAICRSKPRNGDEISHTMIRFSHESAWTAVALRSGAYEFVCSEGGEAPSIARWVPKWEKDDGGSPTIQGSRKANALGFKFSLIDTKSRRHPVIANMNRHSIDVYDQFSFPSTPRDARHYTDVESLDSALLEDTAETPFFERDGSHKTVIETDDHLRTLVTVTGIWVAFCEGWSPYFRYGRALRSTARIQEGTASQAPDDTHGLPVVGAFFPASKIANALTEEDMLFVYERCLLRLQCTSSLPRDRLPTEYSHTGTR
ncbi:MAG: hypothetical protein Q9208_008158 [Pyrenodesmia sp. 3 TL-2023]